ncbi:hypothetical protein RMATCC62417_09219 [Rhizopus microsporus]|nr:hypothetical protein RMATCC62417_09219 [Rhizopus microsporus]
MSGVMDIKHLLCQPCEPYSSKPNYFDLDIYRPVPVYTEDLELYQPSQSISSTSSSLCSSPSQPSPSSFHKRVNSEAYCRYIKDDSFLLQSPPSPQRRSTSTTYIQTRTPWTPEEDNLLQQGYEQGLSWAMISATYLPHRSRGCCWGRFKTLQSKNVIEVYNHRICRRPWKVTTTSKCH